MNIFKAFNRGIKAGKIIRVFSLVKGFSFLGKVSSSFKERVSNQQKACCVSSLIEKFDYDHQDYTKNCWNEIARIIRQADLSCYLYKKSQEVKDEYYDQKKMLPFFCLTEFELALGQGKKQFVALGHWETIGSDCKPGYPDSPVVKKALSLLSKNRNALKAWAATLKQTGWLLGQKYNTQTNQAKKNRSYSEKGVFKVNDAYVNSNSVSLLFMRTVLLLKHVSENYNPYDKESVTLFSFSIGQAKSWLQKVQSELSIKQTVGKEKKRVCTSGVLSCVKKLKEGLSELDCLVVSDEALDIGRCYRFILDEGERYKRNMLSFLSMDSRLPDLSWWAFMSSFNQDYDALSIQEKKRLSARLSKLTFKNYTKLLMLASLDLMGNNKSNLNELIRFFDEDGEGLFHFLKRQGVGSVWSLGSFLSALPFLDQSVRETFYQLIFEPNIPSNVNLSFWGALKYAVLSFFGYSLRSVAKPFFKQQGVWDKVRRNLVFLYETEKGLACIKCLKKENANSGLLKTAKNKQSITAMLSDIETKQSWVTQAVEELRSAVVGLLSDCLERGVVLDEQGNPMNLKGQGIGKKKIFLEELNLTHSDKMVHSLREIKLGISRLNGQSLEKKGQYYEALRKAYCEGRRLENQREKLIKSGYTSDQLSKINRLVNHNKDALNKLLNLVIPSQQVLDRVVLKPSVALHKKQAPTFHQPLAISSHQLSSYYVLIKRAYITLFVGVWLAGILLFLLQAQWIWLCLFAVVGILPFLWLVKHGLLNGIAYQKSLSISEEKSPIKQDVIRVYEGLDVLSVSGSFCKKNSIPQGISIKA